MTNQTQTMNELITTNIKIGMDEVVNVFVAQYEDRLYEKRQLLQTDIEKLKERLNSLTKSIEKSVDVSGYIFNNPVLGLESTIKNVEVNFNHQKRGAVIEIVVSVSFEKKERYSSSIEKSFFVPIAKHDVELHEDLQNQLKDKNRELMVVLGEIKSIDRKERQIRGRISAQKLEQSGFESVLKDEELLKLIQL